MPADQAATVVVIDKEADVHELWICGNQMMLQARSASKSASRWGAITIRTTLPCQHRVH